MSTKATTLLDRLDHLAYCSRLELPTSDSAARFFNNAGLGRVFMKIGGFCAHWRSVANDVGAMSTGFELVRDETLKRARSAVAALVGSSPERIALVQNATEGIRSVLSGIDWHQGDVILLTQREHPSLRLEAENLRRFGVDVATISADRPPSVTDIPERIRFAALSTVSYQSGVRLAPEWPQWLATRGVPWLADASQSVGLCPVNVNDLGCSALVGVGYKWLHGPVGAAFLFVRDSFQDELQYAPRAWRSVLHADGELVDRADATRFELGSADFAPFAGLAVSARWAMQTGWQIIAMARRRNSEILRVHLAKLAHASLVSECDGIIGLEGRELDSFDPHAAARRCLAAGGCEIKAFSSAERVVPSLRISPSWNNPTWSTLELAQILAHVLGETR